MKILQLCKKFPYPLKDGESIAINNLSRALVDLGCEVHLLAMNTAKHFVDVEDAKSNMPHYAKVYSVEVDNRIKPLDAFSNLVKGKSYHISRFESSHFEKNLIKLLKRESFDIIQMETLYLAPYMSVIREYSKAVVAMRAHNVEHEIWERITANTGSPLKKWYLSRLSKQLRDYEIDNLNQYDFLVAITDRDLEKFKRLGYRNGAIASPVGLNFTQYESVPQPKGNLSFSFIGSLDWMPNLNGLQWFIDKVWPSFHQQGNAQLHIAGRNTPSSIKNKENESLVVHGEVTDAVQFIAGHDVMVVPLFSGSGIRVKILEGMALGKVVISTTKGLEGIDAVSGQHVLIANTKEEFIQQMNWCLENKEEVKRLGESAREFAVTHFDCQGVAENLMSSYKEILANGYYVK